MSKVKGKSNYSVLQRMNRSKISYLYIAPYMILFFTFTVLPVLIAVFFSFTSFNILEPPKFIGFDNYTRLFLKDSVFIKGVKNTIVLALFIGPGGYIMSLLSAWFISDMVGRLQRRRLRIHKQLAYEIRSYNRAYPVFPEHRLHNTAYYCHFSLEQLRNGISFHDRGIPGR